MVVSKIVNFENPYRNRNRNLRAGANYRPESTFRNIETETFRLTTWGVSVVDANIQYRALVQRQSCFRICIAYCTGKRTKFSTSNKNCFLSTCTENRRKRSVYSSASKCIIERVSYLGTKFLMKNIGI